ncbi:hypothetical protein ACFLXQ_05125 [Chloroflexota bacterium]
MAEQKIISDTIIATKDTIYVLQHWLGCLERWEEQGQVDPDEFTAVCRQLKDADLWVWAGNVGGHGIAALAELILVQN